MLFKAIRKTSTRLAWSPDSQWLAAGQLKGSIQLWHRQLDQLALVPLPTLEAMVANKGKQVIPHLLNR